MAPQFDAKVRPLGQRTLKLRDDLVWTPQLGDGQPYYQVEDPLNSTFFRVGVAEYAFIALLDGKTPIDAAVRRSAQAMPNNALSEPEAAAVCEWLLDSKLAQTHETTGSNKQNPAQTQQRLVTGMNRWNPLALRIALCHPDRLFQTLSPWFQGLFSVPAFIAWLLLVGGALYRVTNDAERFTGAFQGILNPLNWLLLPGCWLVLKIVHEAGHAMACKKYGGIVREAGIILILFLPVTYVDVTSSWRFRSKWHRLITAVAGMYAELSVAAMAAILWSATGPGLLSDLLFNVVIMASVTTILFNANCLMRFDGYYVLADALEIPNLYTVSRQLLVHVLLKPLFLAGPLPASLPKSHWKLLFMCGYSVAAFLWRTLTYAGMIIVATTLFHGAGMFLAVVAAVIWVVLPAAQSMQGVIRRGRRQSDPAVLPYFVLRLAAVLLVLAVAQCRWPLAPRAPAVVEYAPLTVVRADSPGFVQEICVHDGQTVSVGQPLVVLRNRELQVELNDLRLALRQSEIKCRMCEQERKLAAWQAEAKKHASLETKLREKQSQVERLIIRAPAGGQIVRDRLGEMIHTYVKSGNAILSIGCPDRKELRAAIAQNTLSVFQETVGHPVRIRMPGTVPFHARLVSIAPRAGLQCPHPGLSAANGGLLAVKVAQDDATEQRGDGPDRELLEPRCVARIALSGAQSQRFCAGQIGAVSLSLTRETVAWHLYRTVTRWIDQKYRAATARH